MGEVKINAAVRSSKASSYIHKLRSMGKVPAVVYGHGLNQPIELDANELDSVLNEIGRNALIDLVIKGEKEKENKYVVMVKEIQRDPIKRKIVHADLCRISLKEKVHTTVPIVLTGDAKGVIMGGIMQAELREIDIECMPAKLPESISVDITKLNIGEHLTVGDMAKTKDYSVLTDPESILVTIVAPRREEEPEAASTKVAAAAPAKTAEQGEGE